MSGVQASSASNGLPLCSLYDVALLDLDGVVYIGPDSVPGAVPALEAAAAKGMRLAYVTNNASRPPSQVTEHLREFGLTLNEADVITSAQGAASLLSSHVPSGAAVAVVGGPGVAEAVSAMGYRAVDADDAHAVALVMGYGPDVSWRDLAAASFAVQRGVLFVATNTDRTIPTPRGIAPGNGMLVEAVIEATGQVPLVAGKPEPTLFEVAIARTDAQRPLVVGDRLDTDIEGAVRAGVDSLLVLTGVTSAREAVLAPLGQRPTFVSADLRALLAPTPDVVVDASGTAWSCGGWVATIASSPAGPVVQVSVSDGAASNADDWLDGVRVACAAAWSHPTQVVDVVGLRGGPTAGS